MLSHLLSSRLIQAGIVFCVLCVVGSLLYSWHDKRTTEKALAPHDQFLQGIQQKQNAARPAETVNAPTDTETSSLVNTTLETTDTPMPEATKAETRDATELAALADALLPNDVVSEEEAPTEEVAVSPFGFGPYPEIPIGYTTRHGKTVWQYPGSLPMYNQRNIELIHRVMIASWNDGDTHFIGATFERGKIYLQYPNTMYVRYTRRERSNGTVQRRITSWTSGEHNQSAIDQILEGKIPMGVTLIDMDSEDVGIDPYTFLGLNE